MSSFPPAGSPPAGGGAPPRRLPVLTEVVQVTEAVPVQWPEPDFDDPAWITVDDAAAPVAPSTPQGGAAAVTGSVPPAHVTIPVLRQAVTAPPVTIRAPAPVAARLASVPDDWVEAALATTPGALRSDAFGAVSPPPAMTPVPPAPPSTPARQGAMPAVEVAASSAEPVAPAPQVVPPVSQVAAPVSSPSVMTPAPAVAVPPSPSGYTNSWWTEEDEAAFPPPAIRAMPPASPPPPPVASSPSSAALSSVWSPSASGGLGPEHAAALPSADQIVGRVLADLDRQLSLVFEQQMLEVVVPALARASEALVSELRADLVATLREMVERAVAVELARHAQSRR